MLRINKANDFHYESIFNWVKVTRNSDTVNGLNGFERQYYTLPIPQEKLFGYKTRFFIAVLTNIFAPFRASEFRHSTTFVEEENFRPIRSRLDKLLHSRRKNDEATLKAQKSGAFEIFENDIEFKPKCFYISRKLFFGSYE